MRSVIGPIALIGAWVVVAIPGCIESSCEEKRTCGGPPAPIALDAGSGGDLTFVPRSTGGRAGGNSFGLGGGPLATGGASAQGGSAGIEAEPGANGGETADGGAGDRAAGGETANAGEASSGGEPASPSTGGQAPDSTGGDTAATGGSAEMPSADGASGGADSTNDNDAGAAGSGPATGCDPESRVRKELLVDGRFDLRSSAWRFVGTTFANGSGAHTDPTFVILGSPDPVQTSVIQSVEFPPEAADIKLSFYVRIAPEENWENDLLFVGFILNETLVDAYTLEESIPEWSYAEMDFPATYAGQTLDLIFAGESHEPGIKAFFIDTVSLTALVCP